MLLISKLVNMCGSARKQPRSNNGVACGGRSNSPRRDIMDLTRACNASDVYFDGITVPRRDAIDPNDHSGVGVGSLRNAGDSCRGPTT